MIRWDAGTLSKKITDIKGISTMQKGHHLLREKKKITVKHNNKGDQLLREKKDIKTNNISPHTYQSNATTKDIKKEKKNTHTHTHTHSCSPSKH